MLGFVFRTASVIIHILVCAVHPMIVPFWHIMVMPNTCGRCAFFRNELLSCRCLRLPDIQELVVIVTNCLLIQHHTTSGWAFDKTICNPVLDFI